MFSYLDVTGWECIIIRDLSLHPNVCVLESSQANIDAANLLDTTELGVAFMIIAKLSVWIFEFKIEY